MLYLSPPGLENSSSRVDITDGRRDPPLMATSTGSHGLAESGVVRRRLDGAWAAFRFAGVCLNSRDAERSSANATQAEQLLCSDSLVVLDSCMMVKMHLTATVSDKQALCTCLETVRTNSSIFLSCLDESNVLTQACKCAVIQLWADQTEIGVHLYLFPG